MQLFNVSSCKASDWRRDSMPWLDILLLKLDFNTKLLISDNSKLLAQIHTFEFAQVWLLAKNLLTIYLCRLKSILISFNTIWRLLTVFISWILWFILRYNCLQLHGSSEIHWSYFHLGSLHRLVMSLPMIPDHTITFFRWVLMTAIKVWIVTMFVPPGYVKTSGTVNFGIIVILVPGGKWLTAMIGERVTSSSWELEKKH